MIKPGLEITDDERSRLWGTYWLRLRPLYIVEFISHYTYVIPEGFMYTLEKEDCDGNEDGT